MSPCHRVLSVNHVILVLIHGHLAIRNPNLAFSEATELLQLNQPGIGSEQSQENIIFVGFDLDI